MTSILFAKLTGRAGKVIAFEPVQANAEIIRQNASLNHLDNIDVRACGVSDKRETIYVTLGENPVLSEVDALPFYRKFNNPWSNKAKLDIRTIDEQIQPSMLVDLIKLDVEGAELPALRGAARVLQSRPLMAIEIHNFIHGGKDLPAIRDILAPLQYRYYINGDILDPVAGPFDALDIDFVAKFENPHIYCEPLPQ
jgi:FkbM family methyltransferase